MTKRILTHNEIWRLTFFKMAIVRHVGFVKIWTFEQPLRLSGQICVTVQNVVKIGRRFWRYRDFWWSSRWRPVAILDFPNFKILVTDRVSRSISLYQISSKSVKRLRSCHIQQFSKWRPSAILDLQGVFWAYPRRVLGGLYHCAKFSWNFCSSLAWKCLHACLFGVFWSKMGIRDTFCIFIPLGIEYHSIDIEYISRRKIRHTAHSNEWEGKCRIIVSKTTSGFNSDSIIRLYALGLLLESPFVPSSIDRWAVRAK